MLAKLKKSLKLNWQLYLFLLIPFVAVLVYSYIPMYGVTLAFKKFDYSLGINGSPWIGFDHFIKFFSNYMFDRVITNTIRISVLGTLWGFPIPIIFALALNSMTHMRYKKAVQTITYMPHFISTVVLVGILKQVTHPRMGIYGVIYQAITGEVPKDLFAIPEVFDILYIGSGVWQGFGWGSILYLAALAGVSPELHEAASIDGATRWQRVIHVDIPAIVPTIVITLILNVGSILGVGFEKIYLMQTDMNVRVSEVISTYVYKRSLAGGLSADYGYSTAISLFNNVINMVLLIVVNKIASSVGETSLW